MKRRTYLYRLAVEYPEGSQELGWEPPGWGDKPENYATDLETGAPERIPFQWPYAQRQYHSRTAANRRADLLRKYGANVEVQRSEPIVWPEPLTIWSDAVPPGGRVCAVPNYERPSGICGMPVESEPCPEHSAVTS